MTADGSGCLARLGWAGVTLLAATAAFALGVMWLKPADYLSIAFVYVVAAIAGSTVVATMRYRTASRRRLEASRLELLRAARICPHCGYNCRKTPDRCPECGHALDFSPHPQ